MIAPARRAAFRALLAVGGGRLDSASALAAVRTDLDDPRDVALAAELVTGVLRWQAALDAAVAPLVNRPLTRLDPEVLVSLRLGGYQRLFLTRVPAAAAVNDAVSLVRASGHSSAAGLINAVLRRLQPDEVRQAWPERSTADTDTALDYLSVTLSHPRWLAARWLARHGFDNTERWLRFNNTPAPVTLRPVAWRLTRQALADRLADAGVSTHPTHYARDGLVTVRGNPLQTTLADTGAFVAQDEASQLVADLVIALGPARVFDCCAAPGGKTVAIRGGLAEAAYLVASDHRPRRVALLRHVLARAGASRVAILRADMERPAPFDRAFDAVLVDAPCSGLGTLRREPEIRWRRQEQELESFAARQLRILDSAAACLRQGGALIYATCSSEPDENEAVVGRFLEAWPTFHRLGRTRHPWASTPLEVILDADGDLRTLPYRHDLEAFYAAVLVRER